MKILKNSSLNQIPSKPRHVEIDEEVEDKTYEGAAVSMIDRLSLKLNLFSR